MLTIAQIMILIHDLVRVMKGINADNGPIAHFCFVMYIRGCLRCRDALGKNLLFSILLYNTHPPF
jgi:hypothetical protein